MEEEEFSWKVEKEREGWKKKEEEEEEFAEEEEEEKKKEEEEEGIGGVLAGAFRLGTIVEEGCICAQLYRAKTEK